MSTGIKLRSLNNSLPVNRFIAPPGWLVKKVIHKHAFRICAGENEARFDRIGRKNGNGWKDRVAKAPNFSCAETPLP
jgi:hypothetical protein